MKLIETRDVDRSVEECFRYILDFSAVAEWDPGVKSASRTSEGPVQLGSTFDVECHLPVGTIELGYEITELTTPSLIRLVGKSSAFTVYDTIQFEAIDGSAKRTRIRYEAEFDFGSAIAPFVGFAERSMKKMGKAALDGLAHALNDDFDVPEIGALQSVADKLVLPGMAAFTKLGYQQAASGFKPISRSMVGKHVVLTGASSGIGYAAAEQLARRGAHLTLVMRSKQKAEHTVKALKKSTGNANIKVEIADLSLLADTASLIKRLKRRGAPIDALINNAGALFEYQSNTREGIDEGLVLLLLSPYQLMVGLKELLVKSGDARVVNVVSGGMYTQKLKISKLFNPDPIDFSGSTSYALAKRALMIATEELAASWHSHGVAVNAMHPGWTDTPGVENALPDFYRVTERVLRTPAQGADSIDWAVSASEAQELKGALILDRIPRDAYLIPGTRESAAQRQRLMDALHSCSTASDVLRFNGAGDPLVA